MVITTNQVSKQIKNKKKMKRLILSYLYLNNHRSSACFECWHIRQLVVIWKANREESF